MISQSCLNSLIADSASNDLNDLHDPNGLHDLNRPYELSDLTDWTDRNDQIGLCDGVHLQTQLIPYSQGVIRPGISTAWRCQRLPQCDSKLN